MRTVYLNGAFVPESKAKLSIYDLSVMQAAAAFEMTRSFHGVHFKLREHLQRLSASCELLGIPLPLLLTDLLALCEEVSARNDHGPGEEHRLLIVVSPGCAPMYRDLAGVIQNHFVYIADFPLSLTTKGLGKQFTDGATAKCVAVQAVPDTSIPSAAKHRGRLAFHLAQQEAAHAGADWAIMLDQWRHVVECPGANVFAVVRGELKAPAFGALQGISRAYVLELAQALGIPIAANSDIHQDLFWSGMISEMFVSATPFCLLPIVQVDGFRIGTGKPGPIYRKFLDAWSEQVGLDIAGQIQEWDREFVSVAKV